MILMASREKVHYNIDLIDSLGANINLIYGERSNGKSYQVKHKKAIIPYIEDVERFYDRYYDKGNIVKEFQSNGKRPTALRDMLYTASTTTHPPLTL